MDWITQLLTEDEGAPAANPTNAQAAGDPNTEENPDELGEDPQVVLNNIGKSYELKKIYSKLLAIVRVIDMYDEGDLDSIRGKVMDGMDLFSIVSANLDTFTEQMDDIISHFYDFIYHILNDMSDIISKRNRESNSNK